MLESLKASKFEALTKEQLKNVRGGADRTVPSSPNNGAAAGWVAWHGKNYYCKADSYTLNDRNEYTSMKVLGLDNVWTDITNL